MRSLNRKTPRRLLFSGIETYDTPRARFLEDETSGAPFPQEGRAAMLSRPPANRSGLRRLRRFIFFSDERGQGVGARVFPGGRFLPLVQGIGKGVELRNIRMLCGADVGGDAQRATVPHGIFGTAVCKIQPMCIGERHFASIPDQIAEVDRWRPWKRSASSSRRCARLRRRYR